MCTGACGVSDNPKVHSGCELSNVSTMYRILQEQCALLMTEPFL